MLKSIEVQKNVITVESLALFRPNEKTLNRLGGFFTDVSNAIGKLVENITSANVAVAIDGRKFLALIDNHDFLEISTLVVPYPKEFNADYNTIVKVMSDVNEVPESMFRDLLTPFAAWLAKALNDPTEMENIGQYVNIKTDRAVIARKQLVKVVKNGGQNTVKVNRAIRNNKEWEPVISGINLIAAQNANVNIDDVRNKVKEIDSLLNLLITRMNEPSFEYRPSGAFVDRLVSITYAMAAEVELYAEYQYLFGQLVAAVREDVTVITKALS